MRDSVGRRDRQCILHAAVPPGNARARASARTPARRHSHVVLQENARLVLVLLDASARDLVRSARRLAALDNARTNSA